MEDYQKQNPEQLRLKEAKENAAPWKKWGPYLSERQWGTVREDYSDNGDAWNYFSHDQARSRAYKWGEDGLAGISDDQQNLCFALALWNGKDPILKERLFGLTNSEGNHGEDVKEYYYYLDSTPTHSYMKYLYKYPQVAYPYSNLVETNRSRSRTEMEYELIDTGVFNEDRYFDVFVEYAKAGPEDLLIKISAANRGPEAARLQILPTLWFRNTWWMEPEAEGPNLGKLDSPQGSSLIRAVHPLLGEYRLACEGPGSFLFTENETNNRRLFGTPNEKPYVKDGIHEAVVHGRGEAVNPEMTGTKAAAHFMVEVGPGETQVIRCRLFKAGVAERLEESDCFGPGFEEVFALRLREADQFFVSVIPDSLSPDEGLVLRQALAGMLWSKQYYYFDLDRWLEEHQANPLLGGWKDVRNKPWVHMVNSDIISMPDKWEYPWYAAWDLAFHTIPLSLVDPDFAAEQLDLMLRSVYLHPSGQLPAYEWNFSDVNPPVHAWATVFNYRTRTRGAADRFDIQFLRRAFDKLVVNFTWWVNRKDAAGKNVFEGGFLGLDNIGVFDRSAALPTGGTLEQADGTAWMALYSLNMLEIALELAVHDPPYQDMAVKFLEHFFWIAGAMDRVGEHQDELWDEEDGFYYDVLRLPDGSATRIKVRSMVGLLPICAATVVYPETWKKFPRFREQAVSFYRRHRKMLANIAPTDRPGVNGRLLLSPVNEEKLRRILTRMLDEERFFSPYGIRSLSRWHLENPYIFTAGSQEFRVQYLPAESDTGMFGGNSNWRGPIWFPVNALIIRGLLQYYLYYGNDFKIECPTGSGRMMTLYQVAQEIANRLAAIFTRNDQGRRPVFGNAEKFQNDPHWRDYILFYEYFHGDNGAGIGASHQTGWTGLVAKALELFAAAEPEVFLQGGHLTNFKQTGGKN